MSNAWIKGRGRTSLETSGDDFMFEAYDVDKHEVLRMFTSGELIVYLRDTRSVSASDYKHINILKKESNEQ